jgi:hypothetical protein
LGRQGLYGTSAAADPAGLRFGDDSKTPGAGGTPALHRPVLDLEPFEPSEIPGVDGDEYQSVGVSDGSDLPIRVWRGSAKSLETCSFATVPRRRDLVVGKDRK